MCYYWCFFFFFKQKTAYEMRISDWSSDVCSSDLLDHVLGGQRLEIQPVRGVVVGRHGLRVAVDHDGLEAGLRERVGGMHAAIVELDALAAAVRAAAEDHPLAAVPRFGLVLRRHRPQIGRAAWRGRVVTYVSMR